MTGRCGRSRWTSIPDRVKLKRRLHRSISNDDFSSGTGWRFLPIESGRDQIDGFRQWPGGWRDGVRFRDEGDALGLRMDRDTRITWECTGSLAEVVQELLLLPNPGSRLAPRLAKGHGPGQW
ncbi:hypothetical protein GCM10027184_52550 [Saccharothrix stipae]